jgi:LacI family transcriptional regulator
MISAQDVIYATGMRLKGFRRACTEAGIPEENVDFAIVNTDEEITNQLLRWKEQGITGLFSFCDSEAWREITLMESTGLRVPDDFSIVGFDNIQGYIHSPEPICSIDSDFQKEAVTAIDMLRKRIHDPALPPQRVILPVSLVCRQSCRKLIQNSEFRIQN